MIPTYSEAAKSALPLITNSSYKAFLFFEDEYSENFYEEIVKKITPDYKHIRVICLKGKDSLLRHCQDAENKGTKNKTIYVLDGDFDKFLNKKIQDESIFYLERYSIENYLLEDDAISRIILEENPKINKLDNKGIRVKEHLAQQSDCFFELSSLFLINELYSLGIKSCSEPIQRFSINNSPWLLCEEKIKNYAEDISAMLILNRIAKTENEIVEIFQKHKKMIFDYSNVPGKQILDLARLFMSNAYAIRLPSRESFSFRLASLCKFDALVNLRNKVSAFQKVNRIHVASVFDRT